MSRATAIRRPARRARRAGPRCHESGGRPPDRRRRTRCRTRRAPGRRRARSPSTSVASSCWSAPGSTTRSPSSTRTGSGRVGDHSTSMPSNCSGAEWSRNSPVPARSSRTSTTHSVEEIDVNSATSTWVTYADGRKVDVGALWNSTAELTAFQKRLALRMRGTGEGRLDTSSPMLTMQSNDGSRIVMVLGGDTEHGISTHPRIAIRRFVVRQVGLDGLAELGLFPLELVGQLRALVRCGFTMLVSGPPGAGKTTLLTELLGEVSPLERIITVEKNLLELRLEDDPRHPDAPALFTRHSNAEGEGEITTRQLVELTRRLNPDRVVVGELVEDEALDMLDVASMCKRGSLATIHAHTADIVLQRLAYYVSKSNTNLPEFAVWSLIAQTVDFVVHIDLVRNAAADQATTRRVTSIVEVGGLGERGGIASTEVWGLDDAGELDAARAAVTAAPQPAAHVRILPRPVRDARGHRDLGDDAAGPLDGAAGPRGRRRRRSGRRAERRARAADGTAATRRQPRGFVRRGRPGSASSCSRSPDGSSRALVIADGHLVLGRRVPAPRLRSRRRRRTHRCAGLLDREPARRAPRRRPADRRDRVDRSVRPTDHPARGSPAVGSARPPGSRHRVPALRRRARRSARRPRLPPGC